MYNGGEMNTPDGKYVHRPHGPATAPAPPSPAAKLVEPAEPSAPPLPPSKQLPSIALHPRVSLFGYEPGKHVEEWMDDQEKSLNQQTGGI